MELILHMFNPYFLFNTHNPIPLPTGLPTEGMTGRLLPIPCSLFPNPHPHTKQRYIILHRIF